MKIVSADITGSLIVNGVDVTTNVVSSSIFSGSIAGRVASLEQFSSSLDATFATDASVTASILVLSQSVQNSQAALSSSYTLTSGSYVITSGSYVITSGSYAASSASLSTRVTTNETNITTLTNASASFAAQSASLSTRLTTDETNFSTTSGSLSTRVTNLEATSSTVSSSFASTSGSIAGRVTLIEGQYATTGSNNFTGPQFINQASNAISFTSTASLYTDGGLRVAKDSFVSGTAYFNNITVYGTSSIEYITSSQVNIGSNVITVNTDTPAIRFGGISVFDSGSTQLTGSLFWDSEKNHWIYSNPSGSAYNSAMLMNGPRNTGSLGTEQGTTNNALMKGQGGDHITSSQMIDDGTTVQIPGNLQVTGSIVGSSTVTATQASFTATANTYAGGSLILKSYTGGTNTYLTSVSGLFALSNGGSADHLTISSTGAATFTAATQDAIQTVVRMSGNNASGQLKALDFKLTAGTPLWTISTAAVGTDAGINIMPNGSAGLSLATTGAATFSSTVTATGQIIANAGSGAISVSGTGYTTNPTNMLIGRYTSTRGYIQVPTNGTFEIWNGGTSEIATFNETGKTTTLYGALTGTSATFSGTISCVGNITVNGGGVQSLIAQSSGSDALVRLNNTTTTTGKNFYITSTSVGNLQIVGTNSIATFSDSGNLGLGVTPSAWSQITAIELSNGVSFGAYSGAAAPNMYATSNTYYNGTNWIYKLSSYAPTLYVQNSNGHYDWNTAASGTAGNAITFSLAMRLFNSGNLVVGTTTDSGYKLDVNGTGRFSGNVLISKSNDATVEVNSTTNTSYSAFFHSESGTVKAYWTYINSAFATTARRNYMEVYNTVGGVSIWTAGVKALDINTSQAATFSSTVTALTYNRAAAGTGYLNGKYASVEDTNTTGPIYCIGDSYVPTSTTTGTMYGVGYSYNSFTGAFGPANTWSFYVSGAGTVGVTLGADGNGYFRADVIAYYSDRRLKTNIRVIDNAIDKVKKLGGYYYNPNDLAVELKATDDQDERVGVMAQEVMEVLPHAVKDAPFDKTGTYKTVQYEKLVPLLIQAIKEQQTQIEELKTLIHGLTK